MAETGLTVLAVLETSGRRDLPIKTYSDNLPSARVNYADLEEQVKPVLDEDNSTAVLRDCVNGGSTQ